MPEQPYQKAAKEVVEFLLSKGYNFDQRIDFVCQELGCDLWDLGLIPPKDNDK